MKKVNLKTYKSSFDRGCSRVFEALWLFVESMLISSWIPGSMHRVVLLNIFGASIGSGVVIKPRVKIKFPWRLRVGDDPGLVKVSG